MMDKLKSRKFWFAMVGALLPYVLKGLAGDVSWEVVLTTSGGVAAAYIFGQAYVDGKKESK